MSSPTEEPSFSDPASPSAPAASAKDGAQTPAAAPSSHKRWQEDYGPWLEYQPDPERVRLKAAHLRQANWQRWGMYLSERQWGTVREDYSESQDAWSFFPHDHARSRAYRWGEDGLLGYCDREGRLCFAFAFWNGQDPILKERLYGVAGPEGNHGEDVKELYYYLDATPTASYAKGLYKYPQARFPYESLAEVNRKRSRTEREYELEDTGVFEGGRYFDCEIEYAKAAPDDILIRLTIHNRGPSPAPLHVLPQLWFRNTWLWGCEHDGCSTKPRMVAEAGGIRAEHETLGGYEFRVECIDGPQPDWLFTENESNPNRHPGVPSYSRFFKDAFHQYVIAGESLAIDPRKSGTKSAAHWMLEIEPGRAVVIQCRLRSVQEGPLSQWFGREFDALFQLRREEADQFYERRYPKRLSVEEKNVVRQAYAGLIWTKQFYHYVVDAWIKGDPNSPLPPESRKWGRNNDWPHLFNRDVISMPDKWEYPWYAAWDLAFHMVPMADIDPEFAKDQLVLFLREWYMHPNGQIPAYEWNLEDVNPPVHAWACWKVYKRSGPRGKRDRVFLARTFQKLLLNFTWWVNRKDADGRNLFSGGFLGLDNIGVFDRSKPMPGGGRLDQADATSWMAFFCGCMLQMALELADDNLAYCDMASKFFEHYVSIAEAINSLHGTGLWDDEDGFYYDHLSIDQQTYPLRIRSVVGLLPMCTTVILDDAVIHRLPEFRKRMDWFLKNRQSMSQHMTYLQRTGEAEGEGRRLLAIPSEKRLRKLLSYLLSEEEFLSPHGIRSVSAIHREQPFRFECAGRKESVTYVPGESDSYMFGGNSNWRGPVWFPINFLLVESLRKYYKYYGDAFQVECPTGSGRMGTLLDAANEIQRRLISIFLPDANGNRPCFGDDPRYAADPAWKGIVQFHEYFHGDNGRGLGASHQTGWTALVATMMERHFR